jgi:Ca2+-binding EF-hand superfamily protein
LPPHLRYRYLLRRPATSQSSADGGAEAMFKALDKDTDGSISKEEAKGTPHDEDFAKLDKDSDGKLSREEHAAAEEHAGDKSSSSGASGKAGSSGSGATGAGSK